MRVLHCPTDTGGNPCGLSRAERNIGLDSRVIALRGSYFKYECDEVLWQEGENYISGELKRWNLFRRAISEFDVIHFNFGRSIMPHRIPQHILKKNIKNPVLRRLYGAYASLFQLRDIPWLKKAGKGIVVTYQGSDARQIDYCRSHFEITFANETEFGPYQPAEDDCKRDNIDIFARYADRIYALNPDLLNVLPRHARFLPYASVDLDGWRIAQGRQRTSVRPLVVHAPTHKSIKGTRYIVSAVDRLKREGVDFEFRLVEGISNREAKKAYEEADLCVDQLLVGWYGGFAVEAMALSKPVICYIRKDDLKFVPAEMAGEIPIINASPSTIYDVLKEWITQRKDEIPTRGEISRRYVEKWHDPLKIASALKKEYEAIMSSSDRTAEDIGE